MSCDTSISVSTREGHLDTSPAMAELLNQHGFGSHCEAGLYNTAVLRHTRRRIVLLEGSCARSLAVQSLHNPWRYIVVFEPGPRRSCHG
jgi:hypothetical protein